MAGTQVLAALSALYGQNQADPALKSQASAFLEQWQQTLDAWSVSDAVLHDPASSVEAQYFCAQTLRTKVSVRACVRACVLAWPPATVG